MSLFRVIRHIATLIGFVVFTLYVLGALGIGHFHLYYGVDSLVCTAVSGDIQ